MPGITLGVVLGLWIVGLFGLALLANYLATEKIFFSAPQEGSVEFIMAGKSIRKMLLVWHHHRIKGGEPTTANPFAPYEIEEKEPKPFGFLHYLNPLNWMEPWGIYWIGLYPFYKIYRYDFSWIEEKINEKGLAEPWVRHATKRSPEGQTAFVYVNDFNYVLFANDVKTKSGVPLKFTFVITVRIVNPYKALFLGEDWLERTGGAIGLAAIRYAGALDYEQIVASGPAELQVYDADQQKMVTGPYFIEQLILGLGDGKPDEFGHDLLSDYGVKLVAAKVHSIEFADSAAAEEYRKATTQRYVGEQEGLAKLAKAKGEAEAVKVTADAEAYRVNTSYSPIAGDDKEARMKIRQLEALEKSGAQGGNTVIVPDDLLGLARHLTK